MRARLDLLGVFPQSRLELAPSSTDSYGATLHLRERSGWGESWMDGLLSTFGGAAYQTLYPEFYNAGGAARNFTSLARWDDQKRRFAAEFSLPLWHDPAKRLRTYLDARNENWNLSQSFAGAGSFLSDVNLRRFAVGAEVRSVSNGYWGWQAGLEAANRSFRNLPAQITRAEKSFFADTASLAAWLGADRWLLRAPESRFTLQGTAAARAGRYFSDGSGGFATLRGSLLAEWFPRAKGEDYAIKAQVRAAGTLGPSPLDELFQLGVERDNDLWLRGHAGTVGGRKGAAPLGRRFLLANWEMDKTIYDHGLVRLTLGPFVDTGSIADSSGSLGSSGWQWDTGAQCKFRVLRSVTVVLVYGRDLRNGRGVIFPTVLR